MTEYNPDATPIETDVGAARYSTVAIVLHWAIAALILYNLASGLLRPVLPRGFFVFHVSSGITILLLSVVRVVWRMTHRPPPMLQMHGWERRLANPCWGSTISKGICCRPSSVPTRRSFRLSRCWYRAGTRN